MNNMGIIEHNYDNILRLEINDACMKYLLMLKNKLNEEQRVGEVVMGISLTCRLFLCREEDEKATLEYMDKIGIMCDRLRKVYRLTEDYLYEIEIKNEPSVINTLKLCGYFKKEKVLNIMKMTEWGITFYLVEQYMLCGYLFVPMSNIIAIHTIYKSDIEGLINQG